MKTEADLVRWLEALGAARAGCVFTSDVADTSSVLQQAATSAPEPLRVVSLTWHEVPPLANELGMLVSALGRATLDFFPALYGFEQSAAPGRWSKSVVEDEAHAITRANPEVDGAACRRILTACHAGSVPSLGKLQRAEQARQFALAIEPTRLLVVVAVLSTPTTRESLRSLAGGTEWLAGNTKSRVALVLPHQLAQCGELDHVTYGACLHADSRDEVDGGSPTTVSQSGAPAVSPGAGLPRPKSAPEEPVVSVSPIIGQPAKHSEAEQALHARITNDGKLRPLFAYNQCVETRSGSTPRVDLVWLAGKLIVEVDGEDHRLLQKFSNDRMRDFELLVSGYSVIRFTHSSVIEQTDWVVQRIREAVAYISRRDNS